VSLRIIFMGTPQYAVPALQAICRAGHDVVAVYSQPPRPSGRGHNIVKSAVHQAAESLGIPVFTPTSLRSEDIQKEFAGLNADVAVVVVYGLMLPKAILDAPKNGCINIHASLLPRWRGAAPIQRAMLAGDKDTGVTIMKMDEGLDTGDMLLQEIIPITTSSTSEEIHDRLFDIGSELIVEVLHDLEIGALDPQSQPSDGATYAAKLTKDEGLLDWNLSADELERKIRALNPWPGVWFDYKGERIRVLEAEVAHLQVEGKVGEILDEQLTVACGKYSLRLLKVQKAGGRALQAREFLNGTPMSIGDRLA
jgi:methionyl-tRNA formyltransferase